MPEGTGSHQRPAVGTFHFIDGFSSLADLITVLARSFPLRVRQVLLPRTSSTSTSRLALAPLQSTIRITAAQQPSRLCTP